MIRNVIRGIITLLFGALGFYLNLLTYRFELWATLGWNIAPIWTYVILIFIFAVLGFFAAPTGIRGFLSLIHWADVRLQKIPMYEIMGGVFGLIVALIISGLLSIPLDNIPVVGPILSMVVSLTLAYLGWTLGIKRREEIFTSFNIFSRLKEKGEKGKENKLQKGTEEKSHYKILDTSVIIDGRIADVVQTSFLEGTLLIPSFVLEELRHIADSSDLLKRNRGRRGLDILNQISKETKIKVEIYERDFEDIAEVDSKLVRLGQVLNAPVLTNDYNLNKVAELQGVTVLNINELANALKPVVLPGEEMIVQVMKEGKESGQGIAYLDDGTMIVVDTGRRYMGQHISVMVTSVLQTAAGRMIFAKPKGPIEKKSIDFSPPEVNAIG